MLDCTVEIERDRDFAAAAAVVVVVAVADMVGVELVRWAGMRARPGQQGAEAWV